MHISVVDASVWVSWLNPQDSNHEASNTWITQFIATNGIFVAPTLLLIEVAAALSRRTGQAILARTTVENIRALSGLRLVPIDSSLVQAAIVIASDRRLRAGDTLYVAVAHLLGIPLVSWDKEQLQRASSIITTYSPESYPF